MRCARQVMKTQLAMPKTAKIAKMPIAIKMNFKALPPDVAVGAEAAGAGAVPVAASAGAETGAEETLPVNAGGGGPAIGLSAVPHLTQNLRLSSLGEPQFVQY